MPACNHTKKLNIRYTGQTHSKSPFRQPGHSSAYVNLNVKVTDTIYKNHLFVIPIYNMDPTTGGILLSRGSASLEVPFSTKIYLFEEVRYVYITKTAFDNSTVSSKVQLVSTEINTSL